MQEKRFSRTIKATEFVMAMLLAAMSIIVFLNVVLRYVFHSGINGAEDISRLMFIWLSFAGAVTMMASHGHLGVDILMQKLPRPARLVAGVIGHVLMIIALILLLRGSWEQMLINDDTMAMGAIAYPLSWNYAAGVVAGAGCLFFVVLQLGRILRGDTRDLDFDPNAEIVHEAEESIGIDSTPAASPSQAAARDQEPRQ